MSHSLFGVVAAPGNLPDRPTTAIGMTSSFEDAMFVGVFIFNSDGMLLFSYTLTRIVSLQSQGYLSSKPTTRLGRACIYTATPTLFLELPRLQQLSLSLSSLEQLLCFYEVPS